MKNPDGDIIEINPDDAKKLGCDNNGQVLVASSVGRINATVRITDSVRQGVAVMGHGWGGHTFDPKNPGKIDNQGGTNRNVLISNESNETDPLSGVPKLNGTAISITPVVEAIAV